MKIDLPFVIKTLCEMDDVLILIHQFPDGDTIGSGYSLCRYFQQNGKRARVECNHAVPARFSYIENMIEKQSFSPRHIIAVDTADFSLLGSGLAKYEGQVELCIDHHASHRDFAKQLYVDSSAAATCEIIYKIISEIGKMDREIGAALYTGIATDTGCFKFGNTTSQTHEIVAELMKLDFDFEEINRVMFDTKTKSRILIERMALESMDFCQDDRCAIIAITAEMRQAVHATDDDLEGITSLPRQVEGVQIGITIRQIGDEAFKISVRTYDPIDASAFCARFGGGGHVRAGGCEMKGSILEVKQRLLAAVTETLQ